MPVNCTYHDYSFSSQAYIDNYWNCKDEYDRIMLQQAIDSGVYSDRSLGTLTGFHASSNLSGLAVTPGLRFNLPLPGGFDASLFGGAGIYLTRVSMKHHKIYGSGNTANETTSDDRTRITHFTTLFGAGVEYMLAGRFGLNARLNYHRIFTERDSETSLGSGPLQYLYMDSGELHYHRFLEEKNTNIFEFSLGCRILTY